MLAPGATRHALYLLMQSVAQSEAAGPVGEAGTLCELDRVAVEEGATGLVTTVTVEVEVEVQVVAVELDSVEVQVVAVELGLA